MCPVLCSEDGGKKRSGYTAELEGWLGLRFGWNFMDFVLLMCLLDTGHTWGRLPEMHGNVISVIIIEFCRGWSGLYFWCLYFSTVSCHRHVP